MSEVGLVGDSKGRKHSRSGRNFILGTSFGLGQLSELQHSTRGQHTEELEVCSCILDMPMRH